MASKESMIVWSCLQRTSSTKTADKDEKYMRLSAKETKKYCFNLLPKWK